MITASVFFVFFSQIGGHSLPTLYCIFAICVCIWAKTSQLLSASHRVPEKMLNERYISCPTRALPQRPTQRQRDFAPPVPRRLRWSTQVYCCLVYSLKLCRMEEFFCKQPSRFIDRFFFILIVCFCKLYVTVFLTE